MKFYKIETSIDKKQNTNEKSSGRCSDRILNDRDLVRQISEDFNEKLNNRIYMFIAKICPKKVVIAAFIKEKTDIISLTEKFLKKFNISDNKTIYSEITAKEYNDLIDKSDFINNSRDIFNNIWGNSFRYNLDDYFSESILEVEDNEKILKKANKIFGADNLLGELNRIMMSKANNHHFGHPVHYFIKTNEIDNTKEKINLLLSALYNQKRINSKRISFYDVTVRGEMIELEQLYKNSTGGTVVINFLFYKDKNYRFDDNDLSDQKNILSNLINKYKNDVLTILLISEENKLINIINSFARQIPLYDISENAIPYNLARNYLSKLARNKELKKDNFLFSEIHKNKEYYPNELRVIFDKWLNNKLRTDIYCQYKNVKIYSEQNENYISSYQELNNLIGLSEVKRLMNKIICFNKLQNMYKEKEMQTNKITMNMVFSGNPGTAKTTVARLFAKIMKENEILETGAFVEVGRKDIIGKYVGYTAKLVEDAFEKAKGGVLFIDEAYSLIDDYEGYGDEAISTIVQLMENHREDTVVIFAGYPDKMEDFLNKNEGLRSRIAYKIAFNDYSTEELCEIAKYIVEKTNMKLSDEGIAKLTDIFNKVKNKPNFGNGRFVRNIIEQAQMNIAERLMKNGCFDFDKESIQIITDKDIEYNVENQNKQLIGFSVS